MPITIELPEELESRFVSESERLGISVEEYLVSLLTKPLESLIDLNSGADLVEYWKGEGVIGSRLDILDSQIHAREIREAVEHRTPTE